MGHLQISRPTTQRNPKSVGIHLRRMVPNKQLHPRNAPELEVYTEGDTTAADYYSEVWIPVVEKD